MTQQKIRVLLIDDSGFMRILLADILRRDESFEVVATASNGLEGVEKVMTFKPDVVVTDMVMPQYDGLYVVQELMKHMPLPIILLSSLSREDPKIFDALQEGAFDFVDKPKNIETKEYGLLHRLIREASMADYLKLQHKARGRNASHHTFQARLNYDIIVIGASTGGPGAIEFIINNFPGNTPTPVVVVQHMPEQFIGSFASRLNKTTGLRVSVAQDGERLMNNHIYLAPGSSNLRIELSDSSPAFKYVDDQYKEYNKPSIDCLFESVASLYGKRAIGTILTGMGRDGAAGLAKIKQAGGLTLTQDKSTSVVYGMPKTAFESGAAMYQVPLQEIPSFIVSAL